MRFESLVTASPLTLSDGSFAGALSCMKAPCDGSLGPVNGDMRIGSLLDSGHTTHVEQRQGVKQEC